MPVLSVCSRRSCFLAKPKSFLVFALLMVEASNQDALM